jgi:RNA polymerase sigma-70 factor (sigma-E family)
MRTGDYTPRGARAFLLRMVAVRDDVGVTVADPVAVGAVPGPVDPGPDEFCRRIHPRLVGALRLQLGDPEVARELAQDALVRVIERWPQVSAMDHPEAWTYRVAFNLARSGLRRKAAERRAHVRTGVPPAGSWNVDVAEVLTVRAAIGSLPSRQRQAVVLRYYGDLSIEQVAEAMGCRAGTVKAHLHQARSALRAAGLSTGAPDPELAGHDRTLDPLHPRSPEPSDEASDERPSDGPAPSAPDDHQPQEAPL